MRKDEGHSGRLDREGIAALNHMEEALELLDGCGDGSDVGAHLDLAICRLRDLIESKGIEVTPRSTQSS